MILCKCLVLTVVAVGLAGATSMTSTMHNSKIADMEMLHIQKKVFDLLKYVHNDVLTDAEWFEMGRNYDIMGNIDHYTNREVVMNFFMRWRTGMLQKDALFSYYEQEHREEMMLLYRLFFSAKDFMTFYKTACWARLHMNPDMFVLAFTTAVIYRDDTKFIRLPAIYELYPNRFFDSKVIREAQRIAMTRGMNGMNHRGMMGKSNAMDTVETFYLHSSNLTDMMCMSPMCGPECKLSYFMNDVALGSYYYYFRLIFPFWINTKDYDVPKDVRGDMYYFIHQQLMARYNLERISNGLGWLEDFTWDRMNLPGMYSNMVAMNGMIMPKRDWWNMVPMYKLRWLEYLKKLEIRIVEAIDSGYVMDNTGKQISIMTPEGLNILGNIIEGNLDSINLKYYGSYDLLARTVLGNNMETMNKNNVVPSPLQIWSMNLRDPAFYRIYNRIVHYFLRYKSLLKRYEMNELEFTGVRIENVEVSKLVTYFDTKDYLVNNVIDVPSWKEGHSFNIKTWQYHLNSKPFTYKVAVNSDKSTKAVMRVFLGPAMDGEKWNDYSYLLNHYKFFWMLDEFEVDLKEGTNTIDRMSTESMMFKREEMTGDHFYQRIMQAIEGKEPINMSDRMWGFPEHLMLPKGSAEGMRFKMFFYIGPYQEAKVLELPIFGKRMWYGKSCGFPLDRPMQPWFMNLGNIYFKDVLIYNIMEHDMMMSGHSDNVMMGYGSMMGMKGDNMMTMKGGDMTMKDDTIMNMRPINSDSWKMTNDRMSMMHMQEHHHDLSSMRDTNHHMGGMTDDLNMMHV